MAAADIGTNSTRLLVADVRDGSVIEVERLLEITRLGAGVDRSGALRPDAIARVLACLERYARIARSHEADHRLAVATSAVRDALNRDELLGGIAAAGFPVRVLSGDEEAAATFAGVLSAGTPPGGTLVIDVGGGSTELVLGDRDGTVAWSCSLQMGCVRMTERFLGEQVVGADAIDACETAVRDLLAVVPRRVSARIERAVGVAGTATTAAAIELGLAEYDPARIHGSTVTLRQLVATRDRLALLTLEERRDVVGLEARRAPVIVAGLVVLGCVLDHLGLDSFTVSERDILHGAALLAAESRSGVSL